MAKAVFVEPGEGGWGSGLLISPEGERNKVVSVTGGGIHPVAQTIADKLGVEAVDGFNNSVSDEEMLCVVINCGGTARIGVYPMKNILTIDVLCSSPSGPLASHINESNFVSGVKPENVKLTDEIETTPEVPAGTPGVEEAVAIDTSANEPAKAEEAPAEEAAASSDGSEQKSGNFLTRLGNAIGNVMSTFYQAGRETVDMLIRNILPFMVFISMLTGIINYSGLGTLLANILSPLAGSLPGMLVLAFICTLPFMSPILGPGAVISQVIGVLVGDLIAQGSIEPSYALPALFAIDAHVGCDFIPVGLSLAEAEPETQEIGVPAVLYSRMITGVCAVLIAFPFSFLL